MRDSNLTRPAVARPPYLLWQIVHLQPNRTGAGAFNGVDHLYNVSVLGGPGRLDENGFLDAILFLHVSAGFITDAVSALVFALLKHCRQALRERRGIVDRTERILIKLELEIGSDGDDQRQRIRLE